MGINEIIQVGNRIKEIRKLLGFTQKEIALRAGIPYTTYSNYENNNREPNSEQLRKIARALNVPLSVLLENNELSRNYRSRLREYNDIRKNTSYSAEYKQQILDKYDSELERIKKELEFEDKQKEEAAKNAPKFIAYDENGNEIKDRPAKFTDKSMSFEEALVEAEADELERIQIAYKRLNRKGKVKAVERVEELTEISRYTKEDPPRDPFFMLSKKKKKR